MKHSERHRGGQRLDKIKELATRGSTAGERDAAERALERVQAGFDRDNNSPRDSSGAGNGSSTSTGWAGWAVTPLVDERTGNSCLAIDFPTRMHGRAFEVIDDDWAEFPGKVRTHLKKRGAAFQGTKAAQIGFVQQLLNQAAAQPLILAMKPGFRDDGFILGGRMLGSAQGKYRWKPSAQHLGAEDVGDSHGDQNAWLRDVGKVALVSSSLSCGLMIGLASCIPSYVAWRMKGAANLTPLLSETASFNFAGESGSGKTNIARAVAGLVGPPGLIAKWDFTRRGLEELAETRNDLPLLLDDTETHVDDGMNLKTALRYATQVIPKGTSKHLSKKAEKADLPVLFWSNLGLTTSLKDFEKIAETAGWKRTDGERVRFICIPVPDVSRAGIFDRLEGTPQHRIEQGIQLTRRLEQGVAQNYGIIFPLWVEFLLSADRSARLAEFVREFVLRVAGDGNGWDMRYARKFGIAYAVGRLGIEAGILPWPVKWPFKAVARCYRRAIRAIRSDQVLADKAIRLLASVSSDPERFPRVKAGASAPIRFGDRTLGLRATYHDKRVLAVRDETLRGLTGNRHVAKAAISELQLKKLLVGGQGGRRTTQLPTAIYIAGKKIDKPRYWLIDLRRLLKYVKTGTRKQ